MNDHYHCLLCGMTLKPILIEARIRQKCQNCGWIYYPQLKVTAGVLVETEGCILLVQRGNEPWKNQWYLPAGYVEDDEPPRVAAEREAFEETGFEIKAGKLMDVLFYEDDPRGNGVLILYEGKIIRGEIIRTTEAFDIKYFTHDEAQKLQFAGGSHDVAISQWLKKNSRCNSNDATG